MECKMNFVKLFISAFIACIFNACANMFWKFRLNRVPFSFKSISDLFNLASSIYIWIGLLLYGCSTLLFFYMLSNFKLSAMMPVCCMSYILNIAVARLVFNESIDKMQILGTVIIIMGLLVLSRGNVVQ